MSSATGMEELALSEPSNESSGVCSPCIADSSLDIKTPRDTEKFSDENERQHDQASSRNRSDSFPSDGSQTDLLVRKLFYYEQFRVFIEQYNAEVNEFRENLHAVTEEPSPFTRVLQGQIQALREQLSYFLRYWSKQVSNIMNASQETIAEAHNQALVTQEARQDLRDLVHFHQRCQNFRWLLSQQLRFVGGLSCGDDDLTLFSRLKLLILANAFQGDGLLAEAHSDTYDDETYETNEQESDLGKDGLCGSFSLKQTALCSHSDTHTTSIATSM